MAVEPSRPGKRACQRCGRTFLSRDFERIRRCDRCKKHEDGYSPRTARERDVSSAIQQEGNAP